MASDARIDELLADAGEFFAAALWDTASGEAARRVMVERGLEEKTMRNFGVGFAPVSAADTLERIRELGYTDEEMEAAGIATRSPRGRLHSHFHSRVMFPVRDRNGRITGFAGLGTHVGPSWALWVTSPDVGPYRRAEAVFAIDQAARKIRSSKTAVVLRDCIEVLIAHQNGGKNAVTVHTGSVTPDQISEMANGVPADALELDLAKGMRTETADDAAAAAQQAVPVPADSPRAQPSNLELKKLGLVIATGLVAMNTWTGAPLLALWIGSLAQAGQVLSARGVLVVLVVVGVLEYLLAIALTWLSAKYDELTGRPRLAGETSPWHRAKRGDRVQDIRARFGISMPERIVAVCVILAVLALEIWFIFYAGAPF